AGADLAHAESLRLEYQEGRRPLQRLPVPQTRGTRQFRHSTSISMSVPITRTLYDATSSYAGGPRTSPVRTSNLAPCKGQITSCPESSPSANEASSWVHILSMAKNSPLTLKSAICLPLTSIRRPCPGPTSSVLATFTNSVILLPLAVVCEAKIPKT